MFFEVWKGGALPSWLLATATGEIDLDAHPATKWDSRPRLRLFYKDAVELRYDVAASVAMPQPLTPRSIRK